MWGMVYIGMLKCISITRFEPLCSLIETCCITQANYIQDLSAKVYCIAGNFRYFRGFQ